MHQLLCNLISSPKDIQHKTFEKFSVTQLVLIVLHQIIPPPMVTLIDLLEDKQSIHKLARTKTSSSEKQLTSQEQLHRSYIHIVNSIRKIRESHASITRLVWRFVSLLNIFTEISFDYTDIYVIILIDSTGINCTKLNK